MPEFISRAIVRVDHLLACAMFQSTEETRFYLQGTFIEPHASGTGAVLCATDGHTMLAVHAAEGYASGLPTIWSVDPKTRVKPAIAKWLKTAVWAKKAKTPFWCDLSRSDAGAVSLSIYCANTAQEVLDIGPAESVARLVTMTEDKSLVVAGSFPEWRRVAPRVPSTAKWIAPQAVQSRFLKRVAEMAAVLGDAGRTESPGSAIAIYSTSDGGPVRVVIDGHPEVVCVVMPMRANCPAEDPDWLHWTAEAEPELAKAA